MPFKHTEAGTQKRCSEAVADAQPVIQAGPESAVRKEKTTAFLHVLTTFKAPV